MGWPTVQGVAHSHTVTTERGWHFPGDPNQLTASERPLRHQTTGPPLSSGMDKDRQTDRDLEINLRPFKRPADLLQLGSGDPSALLDKHLMTCDGQMITCHDRSDLKVTRVRRRSSSSLFLTTRWGQEMSTDVSRLMKCFRNTGTFSLFLKCFLISVFYHCYVFVVHISGEEQKSYFKY